MELFLDVVFTVLIIGAVIVLGAGFWHWYYAMPTSQDETHYFRAADGWRLAVHRYRPNTETFASPVILCHGLSATRRTFELPNAPSLASALRDAGWEVWSAELRGSGMSDRPGLWLRNVPVSWSFEDHLHLDVPAIVDYVTGATGSEQVHWVGHSMGGMLIQARLAAYGDPRIASAVTVASPTDFTKMRSPKHDILLKLRPILKIFPIFPLFYIGRFLTPVAPWMGTFMLGAYNPKNCDPGTCRRITALIGEPVASMTTWLDFGRFMSTGVFGPEGGRNYTEDLEKVKNPLFIIAGAADTMAPQDAVCASYRVTEESGDRECIVFGKEAGYKEDYGHMDLLVGDRVESEVFPHIMNWLEKHDRNAE